MEKFLLCRGLTIRVVCAEWCSQARIPIFAGVGVGVGGSEGYLRLSGETVHRQIFAKFTSWILGI